MDTIYTKLIELRKKQEALASDYEEKESYEMAYISRWYVLEKILKIIDTKLKTDELHHKVCKWWEEYLVNSDSNQPEPIKSINLTEARRIPVIGKIEERLDWKLPIINEIMNSKAKWRRKRNAIAHKAEPFSGKEKHDEYRNKILVGISEIEQALNGKDI